MEVIPGTGQQLYDRVSDKQYFQMLEGYIVCEGYGDDMCSGPGWIIATADCGCTDILCHLHAQRLSDGVEIGDTAVYCEVCGAPDIKNVELLSILDFLIDRE